MKSFKSFQSGDRPWPRKILGYQQCVFQTGGARVSFEMRRCPTQNLREFSALRWHVSRAVISVAKTAEVRWRLKTLPQLAMLSRVINFPVGCKGPERNQICCQSSSFFDLRLKARAKNGSALFSMAIVAMERNSSRPWSNASSARLASLSRQQASDFTPAVEIVSRTPSNVYSAQLPVLTL